MFKVLGAAAVGYYLARLGYAFVHGFLDGWRGEEDSSPELIWTSEGWYENGGFLPPALTLVRNETGTWEQVFDADDR